MCSARNFSSRCLSAKPWLWSSRVDGGQGGGGRQLRELNLDRGVGAGKSHHVRTRAAGENLVLFAFPGFPKMLPMNLFCGLRLIFSEQEMTGRL